MPILPIIFTTLLSACIFLIFYTYVIFPFILEVLVNRKSLVLAIPPDSSVKAVSILIPVFNEEGVIEEKIKSIFSSDYPLELIEVYIGSDASDDKTIDIVRKYMQVYPQINLKEFVVRRGKPAVLNELVSLCSHDILIFTDANVYFEQGMIKNLVKNFEDKKTGLAGANILNVGMRKDGISHQEKSYIERENLIKYREGILWGCMMGPFGGCFMMRKELYENVPEGFLVDDFYISMKVIEKNYKCLNNLEAICFEDVSNDIRQEYLRKSRISAGNFQNLKTFRKLILRPFTAEGFCFISHKFIRWITPFLLLLTIISLLILSFYNVIYRILLAGECILLLSPLIDRLAGNAGFHLRFLRFISYFSYMNLALLKGYIRFKRGVKSGVWTPTKRN